MNRNWDIMRNAANGADPSVSTSRMGQTRLRDRERVTSRDREEGRGGAGMFDGMGNYGESYRSTYRHPHDEPWDSRGGYGREDRYADPRRFSSGYERDHGMLGRIEQGIDRAFGNEWEQDRHGYDMRSRDWHDSRDESEHPSLWQRVKGAFTGKGPKNWSRSDERIREDVCERLTVHPYVDASEIEVAVKDGEVILTGLVDERRMKRLAEDVAENVRGVKDVHNQIRVQRQAQGQATPSQSQTSGSTSTTRAWSQQRR